MKAKVKKIDSPNIVVGLLYSANFGTALLLATTIIEAFYAFKLFTITGVLTFNSLVLLVALCYALIMGGAVVFFTLRKNMTMVWFIVVFELMANFLLDYLTILNSADENRIVYFVAQLLIGALCPLATKSFADEIAKKEFQRERTENNIKKLKQVKIENNAKDK